MPHDVTSSGRGISRRTFTGLTAGFFAAHGFGVRGAEGPSDKLNIAVVGLGGRGAANLSGVKGQNIVALCDVDQVRAGKAFEEHAGAKRFRDFRRMFDEVGREIDGVVISTPDHTHFHPAWWAMERGMHVYLEKPLAHEVEEVRRLTTAARAKGLATQLGSQRHTLKPLRAAVELVRAGVLGEIKEVHSWIDSARGMPDPLGAPEPPPTTLDWDLWLGPMADRPYRPGLVPYNWRFWWEFGTGETGNWGCHILDIPFWALELSAPVRVSASGPDPDAERTPKALASRLDFPARKSANGATLGPVSLHWYQGRPPVLDTLGAGGKAKELGRGRNTLFIGSEGQLVCGFDDWLLLPAEKFAGVKPAQTIPPSPGFYREWIDACRGGTPATCNFDYSGPLAEAVLLANIAYRVKGEFAWDATAMKSDRADVDALLRREYRKGWEV
jgi:predicted dehydrogenase